MAALIRRARLVALAGVLGLLGLPATGAVAATPDATGPVAPPVTADPAQLPARATMIMLHGGGWAGHSAVGQQLLMASPGQLLLERGWRIVSVDYGEGAAGLPDMLQAIDAEVARKTGDGPLCLYGESSGAHLALVAASRRRAIVDCVAGVGTPTDLILYKAQGAVSDNDQIRLLTSRIVRFFGTTTAETAPWDPVTLAPSIDADVLLMRQADDHLIAAEQSERFKAAHPGTRTVELERGDPTNATNAFLHGTLSDTGRRQYVTAIASFADSAVAEPDAERRAARAKAATAGEPDATPPSVNTPVTWVHSIALSATRTRALAGSIRPR